MINSYNSYIKNDNCGSYPDLCKLPALLTKISDSTYADSCFEQISDTTIDWRDSIYKGFESKKSYSNLYYKPLVIIVSVYGHSTILLIIDRKTYSFGSQLTDREDVSNAASIQSFRYEDIIDPYYENYGSIPSIQTHQIIQNHNRIHSPDWDPYKKIGDVTASSKAIIRNIFPLTFNKHSKLFKS